MPVPTSRGGGKLVLEPPEEPLARRVVGAAALRDMLLASPFSSHSRIQLDLLHIFKQFSEGQPCLPELDWAHVAQGRVDPRVVAGPHPLVDPLPQMLGVGKRLAVDEPLFRLLLADSITALSYGQPFSDRDLSMPNTSSISSIEALANSLPRSVWKTWMSDRGDPTVANAAFTRPESCRSPTECPTISRCRGRPADRRSSTSARCARMSGRLRHGCEARARRSACRAGSAAGPRSASSRKAGASSSSMR